MTTLVVRELLLKTLTSVAQAINPNVVLPVLRNFKIVVSSEGLEAGGTDLEISITETCPVISCGKPFSAAVPAEQFLGLLKVLSDDIITLFMDGTFLVVKTNQSSNKIKTIAAEEFTITWERGKPVASILAAEFKKMVSLVTLSALTDATGDDIFQSVLLKSTREGILYAVATDRFRYSIYTLECNSKKEWSVLVPAKLLTKVAKTMAFENIVVGIEENKKVTFSCEKTLASVSTMEGRFPDFTAFPQQYEEGINVVIPTSSMVNACKQIGLFAGEHRLMVMDFSSLLLELSTDSDSGASNISLSVGHTGTKHTMEVHCNPDYIADILMAIDTSSIAMQMRDKGAPVLITLENFVHGIMPYFQ